MRIRWDRTAKERARRLLEYLGEECLHRFPRTTVGLLVVGRAFGIVVARSPVGETVHRTAVIDQLPVHSGLSHFLFERRHVLRRGKRSVRGATPQHFTGSVF